jgi:uncharacterized repeat protein (TIGR01451 family)
MIKKKFMRTAFAIALATASGWLSAPQPAQAAEQAPNAAPELSITKTGTQPEGAGKPGPTVFTLRFRNLGNADASGVTITETVGAGAVFEPSLSTPGWTCNTEGNVDVCVWERLEPMTADPIGAQPVQTVTFAITPTDALPPQVDTWTNVVVIGDSGTHGADSNPANNTGTGTAMIGTQTTLASTQQAALVTDANGNGKYEPGDVIAYTVSITNTGARYANGLRLVNDFPPAWNVQIVGGSVSASQGSVSNTATSAYAAFGNVPPGSSVSASFRLSGSAEPPLPLTEISHAGVLEDSYGFNSNTNLTSIPIQHTLIAVASTKAGSVGAGVVVTRGAKLGYTLAVTNTGAEAISVLRIVDEVNDQGGKAQCFSIVAASVVASRGTANVTQTGNTQKLEVTVGVLASGEAVNVSFDAVTRSGIASASCTQVFNQATLYNGALLLAETNVVANPLEPYVPPAPTQRFMYLPLIRK